MNTTCKPNPLPPPFPSCFKDLAALVGVIREPKEVPLVLGGQQVKIRVQALTETQWVEVTKIGAGLKPPVKFKDAAKTQPDGFDEEDPDYVEVERKSMTCDGRRRSTLGWWTSGWRCDAGAEAGVSDQDLSAEPHGCLVCRDPRADDSDPIAVGYFTTGASSTESPSCAPGNRRTSWRCPTWDGASPRWRRRWRGAIPSGEWDREDADAKARAIAALSSSRESFRITSCRRRKEQAEKRRRRRSRVAGVPNAELVAVCRDVAGAGVISVLKLKSEF